MNVKKGQLELNLERNKEADRNFHLGGRSFYFFDFDDNVAFLSTPLILFHRDTGHELSISSGEFAEENHNIGKSGLYQEFQIDWDDVSGTFRHFRDHSPEVLRQLGYKRQFFLEDVAEALGFPDFQWKGPSWSCFYHAAFNQRPVSVITARGHEPSTIIEGISLLHQAGHLPDRPNYLSVFPVSHQATRVSLGDVDAKMNTAELKQAAIRTSVQRALDQFGYSPFHRFGMSDDDPKNLQLISQEMRRLKVKFPEMSFFVIETQKGKFVKHEIHLEQTTGSKLDSIDQLNLL